MSDNLLKGWKTPIPMSDFCEFVAKPVAVEPGKRSFFETKDSTSLTGHRLRARVRMTFAGLPTKNHAVYLPDEMYKGLKTWTYPFNRPIQKHHDDHKDPIGRVIAARYVDTTRQAAQLDSRISSAMQTFKDKKAGPKVKMAAVPLFQELASNEADYRGVGYIEGLWEISDPDAIQKVLDGRFLTVSTSFVPKGAYCSACAAEGELTDWRHQYCDHERGDVVDGNRVVAVPFGFEYNEVSFVNDPAAQYAQVLEAGEGVSFADAVKNVNYSAPYELVSEPVIIMDGKGYRFSDSSSVLIPEGFGKVEKTPAEKGVSVIGSNEQCGDICPQRNTMKLADLIKDTETNYQEIADYLSEESARLTGSLLTGLADNEFAGPNRTFPVKDLAHCEAIKSLLEKVEDSEAKADLLEIVDAAVEKLKVKAEAASEEAEADAACIKDESEALIKEDVEKASLKEEEAELDKSKKDPEQDSVLLSKEELELLQEKAAKVSDLEAARDMLKQRVSALKADVAQLEAANSALLSEQKKMLAVQLVDAQIGKGFKVTDRAERVAKFVKRSVNSLRDSLADLAGEAETGMARKPSGQKVESPLSEDDSSLKSEAEKDSALENGEQDLTAYAAIFDKYYEISFGPGGQRAADSYLRSQKRLGYLPAHVNP